MGGQRTKKYTSASKAKSGLSMQQTIVNQQATELEFKRTPGFQTIKRKDRRRAARFDITPYKPPKKPADFVQFSPEKPIKKSPSRSPIRQQKKKEENKINIAVPSTPPRPKMKKDKSQNKPSLDLQPTVPITP